MNEARKIKEESEIRLVPPGLLEEFEEAIQSLAEAQVALAGAQAEKARVELSIRRACKIRPSESFDSATGEIKPTREVKGK